MRLPEKPAVRDRLPQIGQEPVGGSPEQLANAVKSEVARVSRIIKDAGVK